MNAYTLTGCMLLCGVLGFSLAHREGVVGFEWETLTLAALAGYLWFLLGLTLVAKVL